MALPTITHNSPVAGAISWTAFGVSFSNVNFSIPAGSSSKRFIWWEYRNGAPALVDGDTMPELEPADVLLFLNKNGVGALVPLTDVVDGSLIVSGSVFADAIAANQIQTYHIGADAVTAEQIAAGSIGAEQISAGSITTDKLAVGSVGDNLCTNGSFEEFANGMPVGWNAFGTPANGSINVVSGVSSSGTYAAQLAATSTTADIRLEQSLIKAIPVSSASSRAWYLSARVGAGTATTKGLYLRARWLDANKANISTSDAQANIAVGTTFTLIEGQVTPPAAARYMVISVLLINPSAVTNVYVDQITAREVVMSALIGNGQISTAKLAAGAVTAGTIAANTITADKLLVSDRTNYWENPDFEADTVGQVPMGTTGASTTYTRIITGGARGSSKAMEVDARNGVNNDVYSSNIFPVTPGDQFYIQYDYKFLNAIGTSNAGVGFRTYGPTKVGLSWSNIAVNTRPTTWQEGASAKSGIYTVPNGTYYLQPWVTFSNNAEATNRFHVDNIIIRRMNGGELIVDGQITASKIATNTITSNEIAANAITADELAANAVTANSILAGEIGTDHMVANSINGDRIAANTLHADKIVANSIDAGKLSATAIDGKVITGATLRTAASGARVEMAGSRMSVYDGSNVQQANFGVLTTGGNGIEIRNPQGNMTRLADHVFGVTADSHVSVLVGSVAANETFPWTQIGVRRQVTTTTGRILLQVSADMMINSYKGYFYVEGFLSSTSTGNGIPGTFVRVNKTSLDNQDLAYGDSYAKAQILNVTPGTYWVGYGRGGVSGPSPTMGAGNIAITNTAFVATPL
ncbi:hypothetical protein [Arthrobacter sp. 31Y]|uniref:hypothetical protein n=1 Tax=Arthrobacter sp. 31Y TaxID=1115632 RepID=UPI00046301C6|nr:hypothetical protein [Arthrobacter sp. 31Y]